MREWLNGMTWRFFVTTGLVVTLSVLAMAYLAADHVNGALNQELADASADDVNIAVASATAVLAGIGSDGDAIARAAGRVDPLSKGTPGRLITTLSAVRFGGGTRPSVKSLVRFKGPCDIGAEETHVAEWIESRPGTPTGAKALRVVRVKGPEGIRACGQLAWPRTSVVARGATREWLVASFAASTIRVSSRTGWIGFYDGEGRLFARMPRDGDADLVFVPSPKAARTFARNGRESFAGFRNNMNRQSTGYAFKRVPGYDGMFVAVAARPNHLMELLARMQSDFTLSGVALILIALLASLESARRVVVPLRRITDITRVIAGGAFDVRAPETGLTEVAHLGRSVNHMAGRIQRLMADQHHAGRMSAELDAARMVQEMIFPPTRATWYGFKTYSFSRSASECGGDLWGVVPLDGGRHLVYIADATGHGVAAAFMAVAAKSAFSAIEAGVGGVHSGSGVLSFLNVLNRSIHDAGRGKVVMTMLLALVDPDAGQITFCNAGHPFPLIVRKGDAKSPLGEYKTMGGNILGLTTTWTGEEHVVSVSPGDHVVIYTDGLTDNVNAAGKKLGRRHLRPLVGKILGTPEEGRDAAMLAEYAHFVGGARPDDDATMVVFEMTDPTTHTKVA